MMIPNSYFHLISGKDPWSLMVTIYIFHCFITIEHCNKTILCRDSSIELNGEMIMSDPDTNNDINLYVFP